MSGERRSGVSSLTAFIASIVGLLSPFYAAVSPRRFYSNVLRRVVSRRVRLSVKAAFVIGSFTAASTFSAATSAAVLLIVQAKSGLAGIIDLAVSSPVVALKIVEISVVTPILFATVDSVIVYVALKAVDSRPLLDVVIVRAGSLLPYTLKAPLIFYDKGLEAGMLDLYSMGGGIATSALHALGSALTAYGLVKTLDVSVPAALFAAAALVGAHLLPALLTAG